MPSHWGKTKRQYYSTDYVDKDFPSITKKEEKLADLEEEEALKQQQRLLSTIIDVDLNNLINYEEEDNQDSFINSVSEVKKVKQVKKVKFSLNEDAKFSEELKKADDLPDDDNIDDEDDIEDCSDDDDDSDISINDDSDISVASNVDGDVHDSKKAKKGADKESIHDNRIRRPINNEIKKNRGLTPYKRKDLRNPRVKHRNKYKKTMSKRKRIVREHKPEYNRYSGEVNGINAHSIKSIKY